MKKKIYLILYCSLLAYTATIIGQVEQELAPESQNKELEASEEKKNYAAVQMEYQFFNSVFDPQTEFSLYLGHKTPKGSIIPRLDYARRFGKEDYQIRLDAYPKFRKGTYAFVTASLSLNKTLYARNTFGFELYQSLENSMEISAGYRRLQFSNSSTNIFTASLGKYTGNYWLNLRLMAIPNPEGMSRSFALSARKYGKDSNHFTGAQIRYGSSFEILTSEDVVSTRSFTALFEHQRVIFWDIIINGRISYREEQLTFDLSRFLQRYGFQIGLKYPF